jgi:1,4-dihydroxy-2-naphthoate octaprenyltransferase
MGLVTGLATLNVILVNEYPLHPADPMADRKSLLARTGKNGGRLLYILCSILGWICLYLSLRAGIPGKAFYLYLPVMALSAVACFLMARRKYENHFVLEWIGGLTIAVYLGTAAAFLLAFF